MRRFEAGRDYHLGMYCGIKSLSIIRGWQDYLLEVNTVGLEVDTAELKKLVLLAGVSTASRKVCYDVGAREVHVCGSKPDTWGARVILTNWYPSRSLVEQRRRLKSSAFEWPHPEQNNTPFGKLIRNEFLKFSGDDVKDWVYRCKQFFKVDGVPDGRKIQLASIHMFDVALVWYQQYVKKYPDNTLWEHFEVEVVKRFGVLYDDPIVKLKNLKQTGPVQHYQGVFEALFNKVDLPEPIVVSMFIGGLKLEVGTPMRMFQANTLSEAYQLARMQEATNTIIKPSGQLHSIEVITEGDLDNYIDGDDETYEDCVGDMIVGKMNTQNLIKSLQNHSYKGNKYSWTSEILKRKGKVIVGNDPYLRKELVQYFHDEAIGGHSGAHVTVKKLGSLFYWKGLKKMSLPIPERIWKEISMDFIEKLPTSYGKSVILVVVDRLSKYAHFIPLTHPFTATYVAQVFLDQMYKLHGLPESIDIAGKRRSYKVLKFHLKRSQDRMRNQANKHRTYRQFEVGDWVYLKLQPHRQVSIRLELLNLSQIYPVFHILQLKKCHYKDHSVGVLPQLREDGLLENKPMAILERRLGKVNNKTVMFVLIQWTNKSDKKSLRRMEFIRAKSEVNIVGLEVNTAEFKKLVLLAGVTTASRKVCYAVGAREVRVCGSKPDNISRRLRVTDRVLEDGHRSKMYKVEPDLICSLEPDLVTKKVGTDLVLSWEPDLVTKKVGTDLVFSCGTDLSI
nr:retrotransposon-related protein [Tanacetum cinerariifolium]